MKKIVYSSGIHGAIPEQPAIALATGLNSTVRGDHIDRAAHLDHGASGDLVFVHKTAAVIDAGGTVVLSPPGPAGMAIHLLSGLLAAIPVHRPALAAAARGPTSSRYRSARV
ncbi:hypothetical protein [Methanosphaerula subterraneus]|uniref:hypothetical protein n=1 Tax=Methanosphaerula subterraneus TaxID=3350244 RepID=UPI003F825997